MLLACAAPLLPNTPRLPLGICRGHRGQPSQSRNYRAAVANSLLSCTGVHPALRSLPEPPPKHRFADCCLNGLRVMRVGSGS